MYNTHSDKNILMCEMPKGSIIPKAKHITKLYE